MKVRKNIGQGSALWQALLSSLNFLRQCVIVPRVIASVPWMIGMRGSDALNTCFNAVALAFVLEIDNYAYDMALSDETRADFEKRCRLKISAADSVVLARKKRLYMVLTPLGIFFCLAGYATTNLMLGYNGLLHGFTLVAQISEIITGVSMEPHMGKACCKALMRWLLGTVVLGIADFVVA